ncbi:MAG: GNAT family N-acetyltransferase [Rhodothermales bacterium]
MSITIRTANPEDAPLLVEFILALADYEKLLHEAEPNAVQLQHDLSKGRIHALVADDTDADRAVGFALYFYNYSTFLTRPGIYLEDLFVRPGDRGRGAGFALLQRLAHIAVREGCGRLEWSVLDWNEPSIRFYKQLGAESMDDWTTMRVTGNALQHLGGSAK